MRWLIEEERSADIFSWISNQWHLNALGVKRNGLAREYYESEVVVVAVIREVM